MQKNSLLYPILLDWLSGSFLQSTSNIRIDATATTRRTNTAIFFHNDWQIKRMDDWRVID